MSPSLYRGDKQTRSIMTAKRTVLRELEPFDFTRPSCRVLQAGTSHDLIFPFQIRYIGGDSHSRRFAFAFGLECWRILAFR